VYGLTSTTVVLMDQELADSGSGSVIRPPPVTVACYYICYICSAGLVTLKSN